MTFELDVLEDDRYSGVRSLWLKVIIRAMFDLASYRDSPRLSHKKLAENAYNWLFETNKLFNSFETICSQLKIDAKVIRERAALMTKDDVAKIEFKERRSDAPIEALELEETTFMDSEYDEDF